MGRWESSDSSQSRGRFGGAHIRDGRWRPRLDGDARLGGPSTGFGRVAWIRALFELGLRVLGHLLAFTFRWRHWIVVRRLGCRVESGQLVVAGNVLRVVFGDR